MTVKKGSEPNGLYMTVRYSHELVAQAVFRRLLDEGKEKWLTESLLIDYRLKPWQISLVERYLPQKGEVVGWVADDDETAQTRLANCFEKTLRRFRKEAVLEDAERGWYVELERLALVQPELVATLRGEFSLAHRRDGVFDDD